MPKNLFISYSHADKERLDRLHKHLAQLKREGTIETWYDREITAGSNLDREIVSELNLSNVFLAILSPDFIASNYCYDIELKKALERESQGDIIIVPVIFEPCDWLSTPLKKFKAIPDDGKPVSSYSNENVALLNIASEIRRLAQLKSKSDLMTPEADTEETKIVDTVSRYRVRREFDQVDKRDFVNRSFDEVRKFFQDSVSELSGIPELEAELIIISSDSFSCTVINRGLGRAFETMTVRRSASFGDIDIVYGNKPSSNTSNGGFYVQSDQYQMYFSSGFGIGRSHKENMTAADVAKTIWDELLHKVGVDYA